MYVKTLSSDVDGGFYKNMGIYLEVFLGGCNMITKPKLDLGIQNIIKRLSVEI